jgi:outer membrane lipoprotein
MRLSRRFPILLGAAALALAACASKPPLATGGVDTAITPARAATTPLPEKRVLWGGVIVQTTNLKDATQIEVVGFPLDEHQEPETGGEPQGRFVVMQPGYLESAEYAAGRRITVVGPLTGTRPGRIGERDYTYPVVAPDKIHLWPEESTRRATQPQVHFGIGVGAIFH